MIRVLAALCEQPWATTPRVLNMMISIIHRRQEEIEALQMRDGQPLRNTGGRVTMHGDIAQIDVVGPLFRYANLFTDCSGATSVEMLAKDFTTALNSPQVRGIILNINSPGGEADGVGELAAQIWRARGHKPVAAYVGGMAASGGYWLAAAAERVVMHETAQAGSIGVVATCVDDTEAMAKEGLKRIEVVSSQSPDKRPAISSDHARALVQTTVDQMADVFIASVARYRGVDTTRVIESFGRGYTKLGAAAVAAGMADSIGSFEELLQSMATSTPAAGALLREESAMAETDNRDLRAEERIRTKAILGSPEARGKTKLAQYLALETAYPAEEALAILVNASSEEKPDNAFVKKMETVENPVVGVRTEGANAKEDDWEAEVAAIMQFVPATNRRRAI